MPHAGMQGLLWLHSQQAVSCFGHARTPTTELQWWHVLVLSLIANLAARRARGDCQAMLQACMWPGAVGACLTDET